MFHTSTFSNSFRTEEAPKCLLWTTLKPVHSMMTWLRVNGHRQVTHMHLTSQLHVQRPNHYETTKLRDWYTSIAIQYPHISILVLLFSRFCLTSLLSEDHSRLNQVPWRSLEDFWGLPLLCYTLAALPVTQLTMPEHWMKHASATQST